MGLGIPLRCRFQPRVQAPSSVGPKLLTRRFTSLRARSAAWDQQTSSQPPHPPTAPAGLSLPSTGGSNALSPLRAAIR